MQQTDDRPWLPYLILAFLAVTWGTSYILIKKALVVYSPQHVAALRLAITAIAFAPFLATKVKRSSLKKWYWLLLIGVAGSALPALLFSYAQTQLNSSLTGIMSSLTPLFTLIVGIVAFGQPFLKNKALGVGLGLIGALLLVYFSGNEGFSLFGKGGLSNTFYALLAMLATFCYSLSNNTVQTYLKEMSSLSINAVAYTMVGIPAIIYLLATDIGTVVSQPGGWEALGYVSILALGGTFVASILFFELVKLKSAIFASMVSYLIPFVAILWGIVDGESIALSMLIGLGFILLGLYLARRKK